MRMMLCIAAVVTLTASGGLGLSGCVMTSGDDRGYVIDPELGRNIEIETENPTWNEAGQLIAQARLRNLGPDDEHVMVRTMFLDVDGAALEPDTPWENKVIPPYSTIIYRKASLREGAVDYQTSLRKGRPQ